MTDKIEIQLDEGKYTYVLDGGEQYALRYGELWRDLTGDKFVMALAQRIKELEEQHAQAAEPVQGAQHSVEPVALPPYATTRFSRAEWHDKAWSLFHAKTFDDTQLAKVNIHTIRAVFDATYDALCASQPSAQDSKDESATPGSICKSHNILGCVVCMARQQQQ